MITSSFNLGIIYTDLETKLWLHQYIINLNITEDRCNPVQLTKRLTKQIHLQ